MQAIQDRRVLRLGYAHVTDNVLSLHRVAPIDIRPGETRKTAHLTYLWAFCFEENRLEMHRMDGVRTVALTEDHFSPTLILARWPSDWRRPAEWVISRSWDE